MWHSFECRLDTISVVFALSEIWIEREMLSQRGGESQ